LNDAGARRRRERAGLLMARQIYARLLRYAWPYRGMYLIGVLGMLLYAGSDADHAFWAPVRTYLHDALALQPAFLQMVLRWLPLGVLLIFLCAAWATIWRNYFPAGSARQVVKAVRGELFATICGCRLAQYDRRVVGGDAQPSHLQHRDDGGGHRGFTDGR
jgi:hypothetical protein